MEAISQQTVQDVQEEFRGVKEPELREMAQDINQQHPELPAFLQASSGELDEGAADVAVYLAFMIVRMYEKSYPEIPEVSPEQIIQSYKENEEMMQKLGEEKDPEKTAFDQQSARQPNVLRYITQVLSRQKDKESGESVGTRDQGQIFLTLKTILDALDKRIAE